MKSPVEQRWDELRYEWANRVFNPRLRFAVLAAHPDDETIGASVPLSRCNQAHVVYLTDGAPRDQKLWPAKFRGSREDYARCRREEAEKALAHVSIPRENIEWLGGVDQDAVFDVARLVGRLTECLVSHKPDVLITHAYEGGHPDHDTAALIASIALPRSAQECLLLEMTSYHAKDGHCVTGAFLDPDSLRECAFELSEADRVRKQAMFRAYGSQKLVLENFSLDCERLRLAPVYDFTSPPQQGSPWYEILGWEMTGKRWRATVAEALALTGEVHASHSA